MSAGPKPDPAVPRYGEASLAEVGSSIMSALGVPGLPNALHIQPLAGACLLVVDGLGWEALAGHRQDAPFLSAAMARGRALSAGFPATTAASLGSIGTGLPPGEHGLVGLAVAVPGHDRAMSLLRWELYGSGPRLDLREAFPPERFQPEATLFQRAAPHGVQTCLVGPSHLARSPLERAALRGGTYHGTTSLGDLASTAAALVHGAGPRFVYAYHPELDTTGHVRGVASEAWALELSNVDRLVEAIAERLGPGTALFVTGDHGMVDMPDGERIEVADRPDLAAGVRLLAGEPRARHVHAVAGAADDVLAAWGEGLGEHMWVVPRDQAIEDGWFGPRVLDAVRERIGDVVAAAAQPVGVFQREVDAFQASFVGHHGSLTPAEQLVPFLEVRPGARPGAEGKV